MSQFIKRNLYLPYGFCFCGESWLIHSTLLFSKIFPKILFIKKLSSKNTLWIQGPTYFNFHYDLRDIDNFVFCKLKVLNALWDNRHLKGTKDNPNAKGKSISQQPREDIYYNRLLAIICLKYIFKVGGILFTSKLSH